MEKIILNKSQKESIKKLEIFISNVFDRFFILKVLRGLEKPL